MSNSSILTTIGLVDDIMVEIINFVGDYNIIDCCKFLNELKYLKYYNFNRIYSVKYYLDANFREYIDNTIDVSKKLSICLEDINFVQDVSVLSKVNKLNLSGCNNVEDISCLNRVNYLDLSNCYKLEDVSSLDKVKNLNISNCSLIKDISTLGNLDTLNIDNCYIETLPYLKNLREVSLDLIKSDNVDFLTSCNMINTYEFEENIDLSNLKEGSLIVSDDFVKIKNYKRFVNKLYSIELGNWGFPPPFDQSIPNYVNLNDFKNLHTIKIYNSYDLTDVNMLGNLKCLHLISCYNLQDVSMLGNINELNLSNCNMIVDVGNLGNVKNLNITNTAVTDISMLSNVSSLILKDCFEIKKIGKVDKIKELYLPGEIIPNNLFSNSLAHLKKLTIKNYDDMIDLSIFKDITTLIIDCCQNIINVESLANVRNLSLLYIYSISDVSSLGKISTLNLSGCREILDVSSLCNVFELNISFCEKITDVSMLNQVTILHMYGLEHLDTSMLSNIIIKSNAKNYELYSDGSGGW